MDPRVALEGHLADEGKRRRALRVISCHGRCDEGDGDGGDGGGGMGEGGR